MRGKNLSIVSLKQQISLLRLRQGFFEYKLECRTQTFLSHEEEEEEEAKNFLSLSLSVA
jgi:hypothetical protein